MKGTGQFCHRDAPPMPGRCRVPKMFNAKRYECDLAPYPTTVRVFDACMKLQAFAKAKPSKQPDADSCTVSQFRCQ